MAERNVHQIRIYALPAIDICSCLDRSGVAPETTFAKRVSPVQDRLLEKAITDPAITDHSAHHQDSKERIVPIAVRPVAEHLPNPTDDTQDRKSTRLNSSHITISYAVFCL